MTVGDAFGFENSEQNEFWNGDESCLDLAGTVLLLGFFSLDSLIISSFYSNF